MLPQGIGVLIRRGTLSARRQAPLSDGKVQGRLLGGRCVATGGQGLCVGGRGRGAAAPPQHLAPPGVAGVLRARRVLPELGVELLDRGRGGSRGRGLGL